MQTHPSIHSTNQSLRVDGQDARVAETQIVVLGQGCVVETDGEGGRGGFGMAIGGKLFGAEGCD